MLYEVITLECRVRQSFPGSVRGDEVLPHREALPEVRGDRRLDDLAGRFRHQPAHPGELPHLLVGSPRPRVGHHVDRIEARDFDLLPSYNFV